MQRARLATLATALAACLVATPAAAEDVLTASSLQYEGGAALEAPLVLLHFADFLPEEGPLGPSAASGAEPWMAIQAAHAEVHSFTRTYNFAAGNQFNPQDQEPVVTVLDGLDASRSEWQPQFQVHFFTVAGQAASFVSRGPSGTVSTVGGATMESGQLDGVEDTQDSGEPNQYSFTAIARDGPFLMHGATDSGFGVVAMGDFVVEMQAISLEGSAAQGDVAIASGEWDRPVADPAPAWTAGQASERSRTFVRIFLEDAVVQIGALGGSPVLKWASPAVASEHDGPVTLQGVIGPVDGLQQNGGFHTLAAGTRLSLTPSGERIGVAFPQPDPAPAGTAAALDTSQSATLVGIGAVLALLAAVAVGLLRNATRPVALDEVEDAIAAGRFRRAASLARRVLRRVPGSEDAVLARAIALSKGGRNALAVREITAHLGSHPATDGSLHYVLGLACLEVGRAEEGRVALREAARLTPSLAADIAAKLGAAAPAATHSMPNTPREASGYA